MRASRPEGCPWRLEAHDPLHGDYLAEITQAPPPEAALSPDELAINNYEENAGMLCSKRWKRPASPSARTGPSRAGTAAPCPFVDPPARWRANLSAATAGF